MHIHGSCWPQYYIKLNYATPEILFLTHFNNAHRINYQITQRTKNAATWRNVKIHTQTHTTYIYMTFVILFCDFRIILDLLYFWFVCFSVGCFFLSIQIIGICFVHFIWYRKYSKRFAFKAISFSSANKKFQCNRRSFLKFAAKNCNSIYCREISLIIFAHTYVCLRVNVCKPINRTLVFADEYICVRCSRWSLSVFRCAFHFCWPLSIMHRPTAKDQTIALHDSKINCHFPYLSN